MQPALKQVAGLNSQLSGKLDKSGGTLTGALTLVAGTTTVAPLRLQSGTNLTTPVFGAVEFNGTNLFVTNNSGSPTRKTVAFTDSNITGNAATATTATSAATLTTARNINGQSFNGSADITIPLSAVGNVTLTSPTTGQVLTYNGTAWVNQTPGGGTSPTTPPPSGGGTTITALSTSFDSGITPFTVGTGSGQTFTATGGVATGRFTSGSYVSMAGWTNSAQFVANGEYSVAATATCPTGSGYISVEFVFFKDTGSGWTETARISFDSNTAAQTTKTATFSQGATVQPIICQIIASNPNIDYLVYDFTLTKTN